MSRIHSVMVMSVRREPGSARKREAGGFWCSVCEVNAEITGKRLSEHPARILDDEDRCQENLI